MAKTVKKKVKKRKVGRPKRKFTAAQIKQMEKYALAGCQNGTIATLMGIPKETLVDNFRTLLTKKRCERKYNLRENQNDVAEKGSIPMLIFLGKNELDQKDRQETDLLSGGKPITPQIVVFGTPVKAKDDTD